MKKIILISTLACFVAFGAFAKKNKKAEAFADLENSATAVESESSSIDNSSPLDEGSYSSLSSASSDSASNASGSFAEASSDYDMSAPLKDRPDDPGIVPDRSAGDASAALLDDDDSFEEEYFDPEDEEEVILVKDPKFVRDRIDMPHRTFEMGMKFNLGVNNSYLNASDMMVENLVIDVNKIADDMPDNGLMFNLLFGYNAFSNLNLKNGVHVGFNAGLDMNGNFGLGKEIFEFLAKGNGLGQSIKVTGDAYADAFVHTDVTVGLTILNGYHLEITPSLFRPVAHVVTEKAVGDLKNSSDGKVYLDAKAKLNIYTFLDVNEVKENFTPDLILNQIKNGWGFDIASSLDKQIMKSLCLQAYSRIPIVPGRLNYKTELLASADGHFDGLNTLLGDEADDEGDFGEKLNKQFKENFSFDTSTSNSSVDYSLHRPFRLGAQFAWEPFGTWFTVGGLLGFGFKDPFSSNSKGYMEYQISSKIGLPVPVIGQILSLKLSSGYLSESFIHEAVFGVNFRALEFNAGVSVQSSSFASSFKGSGLGAFIYLAYGW